ncbi:DUF951 domain-containing protein [Salinicoccus hispanicus]|uniref:DUF951 family protein n=1 Tax=Salinicoccus hispanicus TaxID=157225 RepID=A0A6N8U3F9_9STAP|nr:DUF951 domain-containing protein [Salinicoccus hispanicus]MXQ51586.1 DUF951 family protein [Salinicoccus hispanicus]
MSKEYDLNDIVEMKKQHPCGNRLFRITRMGADIKIKCTQCDRVIMMPRRDFEKRMKAVKQKYEA